MNMRQRINREVFTADSDNDVVGTPASEDHVDIDDDDNDFDDDTQASLLSMDNTPYDQDDIEDSMTIDTMDEEEDEEEEEEDEDEDIEIQSSSRRTGRSSRIVEQQRTKARNTRYIQQPTSLKRSAMERVANSRRIANEKRAQEAAIGNESDFSLFTAEELAELSGSEEEYTPQRNDLSSMTKRQRAKYLEEDQEDLMELPVETKKRKLTQEEVALRRTEVLRKREQQRKKKLEDIHRETIDKLLKKPSARKNKKGEDDETGADEDLVDLPIPTQIHYVTNNKGATLSLPPGVVFPGTSQHTSYPVAIPNCTAPGCHAPRKYKHPKQQWLACSLEHYRLQLKV
ncbi:hypothetical protein BDF19DRAFT_420895 [Syncephalis fuscata]|nr:hypothetical protein BDF19DRAFT_420895 [Syncephalis fuscata]